MSEDFEATGGSVAQMRARFGDRILNNQNRRLEARGGRRKRREGYQPFDLKKEAYKTNKATGKLRTEWKEFEDENGVKSLAQTVKAYPYTERVFVKVQNA